MSTKTTIKRIALVAVSALGMGLMSVIPARAAATVTVGSSGLACSTSSYCTTAANGVTTQVGTAVSINGLITTSSATNTDYLTYTISLANSATGSTMAVGTANSSAAASGEFKFVTGSETAATGWTLSTTSNLIRKDAIGATPDNLSSTKRFTVSVNPDKPGDYAINMTVKTYDSSNATNSAIWRTLTFYVHAYDAVTIADQSSITIGTIQPVRVGTPFKIPFTYVTAANANNSFDNRLNTAVVSVVSASGIKPVGSSVYFSGSMATSTNTSDRVATVRTSETDNAANDVSLLRTTAATASAAGAGSGYIYGTVTGAGTYSLVIKIHATDTTNAAAVISNAVTITTVGAPATVTITPLAGSTSTTESAGTHALVSLKDAAGNATVLDTTESLVLSATGTTGAAFVAATPALLGSVVAANTGSTLGYNDFIEYGKARTKMSSTSAGAVVATATGASALANTLVGTGTITTKAASGAAATLKMGYPATATGYWSATTLAGGATTDPTDVLWPTDQASRTITVYGATADDAEVYVVTVTDTSGSLTGYAGSVYTIPVTMAKNTTDGNSQATFTVSGKLSTSSKTAQVAVNDSGDTVTWTVTGAARTQSANSQNTMTPSSANLAAKGSATFTLTATDKFGDAWAGQLAVWSVTGRNATVTSTNTITDANGQASFTLTDAYTGTALTSDTVSVAVGSAGTYSGSATVTYSTSYVADSVTLTTDNYVAGVANDTITEMPISAAYGGATGGKVAITAKVKNAAGAVLAGVPVTFSVAGDGVAILSTYKTAYTTAAGIATSYIYAWKTGTYTITATAGAKSATATESFYSASGNERTISASAAGNLVVAKATDRFGNPVKGVKIYAKIASGDGFFGVGVLSTDTQTDANGEAKFVVTGGSATVTVSNISFSDPVGTVVGQTSAAKGYDIGGSGATALTAYVAGTSLVAEKGVGSSFDAAGVSSASVDVSVSANTDAIDAANEATDAANAATDAANAAAEAADAATAAAQDAQAAVAELATKVSSLIASIKSQLTSLTNLIIKIQKKVKA